LNKLKLYVLILLLNMSVSLFVVQTFAQGVASEDAIRKVEITVKLVFIGFDQTSIDTSYFTWKYQTLTQRINNVWNWNNWLETGVAFSLNYEFVFTQPGFKQDLITYLRWIEETKTDVNRWFYYWEYDKKAEMWTKKYYTTDYVTYDAEKVENWLFEHRDTYGGFPKNGWTFLLMYLPELPSLTYDQFKKYVWDYSEPKGVKPHYYSISPVDVDRGFKLRYRDFMIGYGGHRRLWFLDLSAGPTWWSQWDDLPLQIVLKDQSIQLDSSAGKQWLTQYLADYTRELTYNIIVPEFIYDPIYTRKYVFRVFVLDDRTAEEKTAVSIEDTIRPDLIKPAFEDLTPYATVNVTVDFMDTDKYPELANLLDTNRHLLETFAYKNILYETFEYIDERPIYKYLQDNLGQFVPQVSRNGYEFTVPIFTFALSGDVHFGGSAKWYVGRDMDRTYEGIAQGDLVMIGVSQTDFQWGDYAEQPGKGLGLTNTVIHEAGHMIGLSHPHNYGWVGDFIFSVMGYFAYDYAFGQHDKDALQRIHADRVIMNTSSTIQEARTILQSKVKSPETEALLNEAQNRLKEADDEYSTMNYTGALTKALEGLGTADVARDSARELPEATVPLEREIQSLRGNVQNLTSEVSRLNLMVQVSTIAGTSAGLVLGALIMWAIYRRRVVSRKIPTGVQTKPCVHCGAQMPKDDMYCLICGTKQE